MHWIEAAVLPTRYLTVLENIRIGAGGRSKPKEDSHSFYEEFKWREGGASYYSRR